MPYFSFEVPGEYLPVMLPLFERLAEELPDESPMKLSTERWVERARRWLEEQRRIEEFDRQKTEPKRCRRCGVMVRYVRNPMGNGIIPLDVEPGPGGRGFSHRLVHEGLDSQYVHADNRDPTEMLYRPHKCRRDDIEAYNAERLAAVKERKQARLREIVENMP